MQLLRSEQYVLEKTSKLSLENLTVPLTTCFDQQRAAFQMHVDKRCQTLSVKNIKGSKGEIRGGLILL